ncbi:MAG TPA: biotin carboxylase N-terminal domain-containing protein, partial [Nitrososphaerales archaeon]|nr:biotin carboxylase N-terminal domain-containing protein [Nitrososphaerales archaeon]
MFHRVLVANRGEIAVRIIRECRLWGIETVAVYSDCDADALHVKLADRAVRIGTDDPGDSYLNIEKVIRTAVESKSDALHPGYGFISDNWILAAGCEEAGIAFIGPSPKTLSTVANKVDFKRRVRSIGVPTIEGSAQVIDSLDEAKKVAKEMGYPVLLKSAFGGGGRGIRSAASERELVDNFNVASTETRRAFGRAGMYIEKLVSPARHIEVQILADGHGATIHLGERECSIQRRHQKLLELTPSPAVDEALRKKVGGYAVAIARAVDYKNAGTMEFLMDADHNFYFIEVNARLQVE